MAKTEHKGDNCSFNRPKNSQENFHWHRMIRTYDFQRRSDRLSVVWVTLVLWYRAGGPSSQMEELTLCNNRKKCTWQMLEGQKDFNGHQVEFVRDHNGEWRVHPIINALFETALPSHVLAFPDSTVSFNTGSIALYNLISIPTLNARTKSIQTVRRGSNQHTFGAGHDNCALFTMS
ncbi:hypothetical protein C8R44DRAFT_735890 [Mycena epipterygia]|nr:hypothetical protein C8R44DRAFT_735890 [Mycena epipterygia]